MRLRLLIAGPVVSGACSTRAAQPGSACQQVADDALRSRTLSTRRNDAVESSETMTCQSAAAGNHEVWLGIARRARRGG